MPIIAMKTIGLTCDVRIWASREVNMVQGAEKAEWYRNGPPGPWNNSVGRGAPVLKPAVSEKRT